MESKDSIVQGSPEIEPDKGKIKDILSYVIITAVVVFLFGFVLKPAVVSGDSMNDTYKNNDVLMCLRQKAPHKGDVVVFKWNEEYLVKRVIAEEGDTINIDFDEGTVTLNDEVLSEPYIKEPTHKNEGTAEYPLAVPDSCFFVMGDNRNNSSDSRNDLIGFVNQDQIIGVVWFKMPDFEGVK